jgi:hypothetical protein
MRRRIVGFFLFLSLMSSAVLALEGGAAYVLRLIAVPPLKVGLTTHVGARWDKLNSSRGATHVVFEVYEGDAANVTQWRWINSFHDVAVGDEVALLGNIYRVSAINYTDAAATSKAPPQVSNAQRALLPYAELQGGCGQHCGDFVSVVDTGRDISPAKNEAIVLARSPLSGAVFFHGSAEFQIKLDSLKRDSSGKYYAEIAWRRGDQLQDVGSVPRNYGIDWSADWTHVTVHLGDYVDLPAIGGLRVESILPSQSGRADWVVIVADNRPVGTFAK